ncbi:MAG: PspA/IM30 family protein [Pseudomonadota bacterium]
MFETLTTLFRARTAEAEEGLIDRNAVTLLAQHLRDARAEMAGARAAIARLMAREAEQSRALDALKAKIKLRETEAKIAIDKGEDDLAADIADAIIALEDRIEADEATRASLATRIREARERMQASELRLTSLTDQLRAARDTSLTRSSVGIAAPTTSALEKAVETARVLKARDQRLADLDEAHQRLDAEVGAETLDARIAAAGLSDEKAKRREALLKRITKPNKGDKS